MLENFDLSYEVCTCQKVTIKQILFSVKEYKIRNLGQLQELTKAGTQCRNCIFSEGDFGKVKKKIYCKDILKKILNG